MTTTRRILARSIKTALRIPNDAAHIHATRALVAWMGSESGWYAPCNGQPGKGADFNPLNTTLTMPGSTYYNHLSAGLGVQNYVSATQGAGAVRDTLLNTPGRNYEPIVAALSKRYGTAKQVMVAIGASDWGTNAATLLAVLETYQHNRATFNAVLVGS